MPNKTSSLSSRRRGILHKAISIACALALIGGVALPRAIYANSGVETADAAILEESLSAATAVEQPQESVSPEGNREDPRLGVSMGMLGELPSDLPTDAPSDAPEGIPDGTSSTGDDAVPAAGPLRLAEERPLAKASVDPASEAVALSDPASAPMSMDPYAYPDGIEWKTVLNYKGEPGTCVWGISGTTVYIRPPDGATEGDLPSLEEAQNYTQTTVPWERVSAEKVVIFPGVKANGECQMFHWMYHLTEVVGLENLDISNATSLSNMFFGCRVLESVELPDWGDAPELVDMSFMFMDCQKLGSITFGEINAPKMVTLQETFQNCLALTLVDMSKLDIPNVEIMYSTFYQSKKIETIIWPEKLDTSHVWTMSGMFEDCKGLGNLDLSGFDTSSVVDMEEMFRNSEVTWLNMSSFRMSHVENTNQMFYLAKIKKVTVDGENTVINQLNSSSKLWYMLDGEPCVNGKIPEGASGTYVIVDKVEVSETAKVLPVGSAPFTLTATVFPADVKVPVTWSSSKSSVATVDANGNVTMHAAGRAKINASCLGVTGTCVLDVVSVSLDAPTKTVGIKAAPFLLKAKITPTEVKGPLAWSSSDKSVATVVEGSSKNASVTPKGAGTTDITVECHGSTYTCVVTVASMAMSDATKTAYLGEDPFQLSADVNPSTVEAPVLWASSNTAVATVDERGLVTPVKKGSATITATLQGISGVDATCALTVKDAVVEMDEAEKTVGVGAQPFTLGASVMPSTVTQPLSWRSSDEGVATVDSTGTVTVHKAGRATITAQCADSEDSCSLTVVDLTLSESARRAGVGTRPFQLGATVEPAGMDAGIIWSSSDDSIASVDDTGLVTIHDQGRATITAAVSGIDGASDACEVTACSVILDETSKVVGISSAPFALTAAIFPLEMRGDVTWASSNPSVAKIDANGIVTVLSPGTAEIAAELVGSKSVCNLVVVDVSLSETERTVAAGAEPFALQAAVEPEGMKGLLSWSSSDPAIASVDERGVVTAKAAGTVEIEAAIAGERSTCEVTVVSLSTDKGSLAVLRKDSPLGISVSISPSSLADEISWGSSNANVAEVASSQADREKGISTCTLELLDAGTSIVTATLRGISVPLSLTVLDNIKLVLSETSKTVEVGDEPVMFSLIATILPDDVSVPISWSSSDESVATVDDSGNVTVCKPGTAEIAAQADDARAVCLVSAIEAQEAPPSIDITIPPDGPNAPHGVTDGNGNEPGDGAGDDGGNKDRQDGMQGSAYDRSIFDEPVSETGNVTEMGDAERCMLILAGLLAGIALLIFLLLKRRRKDDE